MAPRTPPYPLTALKHCTPVCRMPRSKPRCVLPRGWSMCLTSGLAQRRHLVDCLTRPRSFYALQFWIPSTRILTNTVSTKIFCFPECRVDEERTFYRVLQEMNSELRSRGVLRGIQF